ncbi:hypothetical protein [Kordiimonas aestuarii]|uniref:hypothetical protein n=1 Tax=Kordiimonas aestuarii TaxID=1005925 RepID=UPI0021CFA34D|nr:hypothetical protein [Kordiimonas aestuarii]
MSIFSAAIQLFWGGGRALVPLRKWLSWSSQQEQQLGSLGLFFSVLDRYPYKLTMLVHIAGAAASVIYFGKEFSLVEKCFLGIPASIHDHFQSIFWAWLIFALLDFLAFIPALLRLVFGSFAVTRNTYGWANASWHAEYKEHATAVIPNDTDHIEGVAGNIIDALVTSSSNPNRAIRPEGLTDEVAANILFVGHIVEARFQHEHQWLKETEWTAFYQELGALALIDSDLFSSKGIASPIWQDKSYAFTLAEAIGGTETRGISGLLRREAIATSINESVDELRRNYGGSALKLATGFWCSNGRPKKLESNLKKFRWFAAKGMRRQFLKLTVIWNLHPHMKRPKVFAIPFNAGMARYLLDRSVMRTTAKFFKYEEEQFQICFDLSMKSLLETSLSMLTRSNTPNVKNWRLAREAEAEKLKADPNWYITYRVDQYIYHLGKTPDANGWQVDHDNKQIKLSI